jgi:hypothetical protein
MKRSSIRELRGNSAGSEQGLFPAQIEAAMFSVVIPSGKNKKQPAIGDQQ